MKNKKKVPASEKKVSAMIPIPKLDHGFGSQYRNVVSVAHCIVMMVDINEID